MGETKPVCTPQEDSVNEIPIGLKTSAHKDTGWAWVVVFAGTMCFSLSLGIYRSMGVFLVELMDVFDAPTTQTSLLFSCFGVSFTVSALFLNTALGGVCHERALVVIGALVGCLGFVLTYLTRSVEVVTFGLGLTYGITTQTCMSSAMSITVKYFKKRLALACSIVVCGSSIGVLLWPLLMRYLIDEYSYQGAFLIVGGLVLNNVACAALMRPFPGTTLPKLAPVFKTTSTTEEHMLQELTSQKEYGNTEDTNKDGILHEIISQKEYGNTEDTNKDGICYVTDKDTSLRPENSIRQNSSGTNNVLHLLKRFALIKQADKTSYRSCEKLFALELFKNPIFILMLFFNLFSSVSVDCLIQFYPAAVRDMNMDKFQAATLLSLIGFSGLFGRLLLGFIGDYVPDRYKLIVGSQIILSIAVILFQLATTFWSQVLYAVTVGLTFGVPFVFKMPLLRDFFDNTDISKMVGINAFVIGVGRICSGPFIGWLRDRSGGYTISMYLVTAMLIGNSLLLLVMAYLRGLIRCK